MPAAIPASAIVSVNPGVIAAGGRAVALTGLMLTNSTRPPIGQVLSFASAAAVASYFGASSTEAAWATVYFNGFDTATQRPAALLFAQYAAAPVAGYLRGGNVAAALTLAQLQALTPGTLAVTVDGTPHTSSTITLSAATSFSSAAAIIAAAFTGLGATVAFDSVSGAFTFTSSTTGASSSVSVASGALAAPLLLTTATGAVTSAGAAASTPGVAMSAIVAQNQAFGSFSTLFEPATVDKVSFAAWNNGQSNQYAYVCWGTDITDTTNANTASAAFAIVAAGYSGTILLYQPSDLYHAPFVQGTIASIDFTRLNGRQTLAFRSQAGLTAGVTNQTIAAQLIANGLNFYGAYASSNAAFTWLYPGQITGKFLWADSYLNQIQLNDQLQSALLALLYAVGNIPYNAYGYGLIEAACADPIGQALNFGSIRPGVTLSALQIAEINAAAGRDAATAVSQRGWYLLVVDPPANVRTARGSPPITLWYADGQSVQSINIASLEVQ